jgi:YVTN family beta-propeller protein
MAMEKSLRRLGVGALLAFVALGAIIGTRADAPAEAKEQTKPRLRRPVALALANKGKYLFVANRASGVVSVIDTGKTRVLGETEVGRKLADIAVTPDEKYLLAVDEEADELIVLGRDGPALEAAARVALSRSPVSVRTAADGKHCLVASLWARELTVVRLPSAGAGDKPRVKGTVGLPFAPRLLLPVPDTDKAIVADAFGGQLALVDVVKSGVDSVRTLPAHQIRGLAWSNDGKQLLLTHQVLHADARTNFGDIHWGNLIVNYVRALSRADVLNPDADLLKGSRLLPLGDVGHGTGDPAGLAVGPDGTAVVALAGVGEVAVGSAKKGDWTYLEVGRRPTAVALDAEGRRAFVANTLSESVSVIDLSRKEKGTEIALGTQPELKGSERGELLFFDAKLSRDGWLSCNSCHVDGHTNGLLNDNLSDGTFGTPKRVLSLLGVKDTPPWAWNGGISELKDQVRKSVEVTMAGAKPTDEQVQDLEAFLRTLPPPPPLRPETAANKDAVGRGKEVFNQQGCASCHAPPAYTSGKTYDVGLADEAGHKTFNPPSLRGVGHGGPYFHDNRAATLEDVFTLQRHQLKKDLSKEELVDLLTFLRAL